VPPTVDDVGRRLTDDGGKKGQGIGGVDVRLDIPLFWKCGMGRKGQWVLGVEKLAFPLPPIAMTPT
jgi:hypothetical protein